MSPDGCPIFGTGADSDLEFTRQELKLRMVRGPLANPLCVGTRICNLVKRRSGKLVRRHVTDGVTAGLYGVHIDICERIENIRGINQPRPVKLDILAGRKVPVTMIPTLGDVSEASQLPTRNRAVRYCDPQHVSMQLQINAVHQSQRLKLVFCQCARQASANLIAVLSHALANEIPVKGVIAVQVLHSDSN